VQKVENESSRNCAQVTGAVEVHLEGEFVAKNGEHRAPISKKKWITVRMLHRRIYVGLRNFYFSNFLQKILPAAGVCLTLEEWQNLLGAVQSVNSFLLEL